MNPSGIGLHTASSPSGRTSTCDPDDLLAGMIEIRHARSTRQARSIYRQMHHQQSLQRPARFWRWLAGLVDLPPGSRLLDIACGDAAFGRHLQQRGYRYVGLDADRLGLQGAADPRHDDLPSARVAADGQALPFARGAFDGVCNIGSLEHFEHPLAGLREMARVLRPGGLALILVPNSMGLRGPVLRAWRSGEIIDDGQPIQRYGTREQWRRLLEAGGLRPRRVLGCESLAPWPRRPRDWSGWLRHPSRWLLPAERWLPASLSVELVFLCQHATNRSPEWTVGCHSPHRPVGRPALDRIAAVLVCYRNAGELIDCARALTAQGLPEDRLCIVDNDSGDGSIRRIRTTLPAARLLENERNLGFAAACNRAIRHLERAADPPAATIDAYLLINPDTRPAPDFLARLVRPDINLPRACHSPTVLLDGPSIKSARGDDEAGVEERPEHGPRDPNRRSSEAGETLWFAGAWRGRWPGRLRYRSMDDPGLDVDYLWACCMLIGRETWRRVGPFDERYFMYYEDMDWCDRARAAGVPLRILPEARLWHRVGGSFGGADRPARRELMCQSAMRYHRGLGPAGQALRLLAEGRRAIGSLLRGDRAGLRAQLQGLRAGWREIGGEVTPSSRASAVVTGDAADPGVTFIVASAFLPTIGDCLASILAQSQADRIERILVFGAGEAQRLPRHPAIRRMPDLPPGPACAAYNLGLSEARSAYLAFVDSDCLLAPDWMERVADCHRQGWDVVAGGLEVPDGTYLERAYNFSSFHDYLAHLPSGPRPVLPTMNLSVRADAARAVGRFRQDLPRMYDFDWTLRMRNAGFRLRFEAGALVRHHPCGITPAILWRTWYAGGAASQLVRREQRHHVPAPRLLDHPRALRAVSPALATWVTLGILRQALPDPRIWPLLPAIWLCKLAWCLGAARGRRHGPIGPAQYRFRAPRPSGAARR